MTVADACFLFAAAAAASALNAVAGGGGFVAFPALVFARVAPLPANAMTAVALWPGSLASVAASAGLAAPLRRAVAALLLATGLGAVAGAALVLHTPPPVFLRVVPFLLLGATGLFALSGYLVPHPAGGAAAGPEEAAGTLPLSPGLLLSQLLIGVYGGYFGAGLGIMLLAALGLSGMRNLHAMNALKVQLVTCNNAVSAGIFLFSGLVLWPQTLAMMAGAVLGGWAGSRYGRRLPAGRLRWGVVVAGLALSVYFFVETYA